MPSCEIAQANINCLKWGKEFNSQICGCGFGDTVIQLIFCGHTRCSFLFFLDFSCWSSFSSDELSVSSARSSDSASAARRREQRGANTCSAPPSAPASAAYAAPPDQDDHAARVPPMCAEVQGASPSWKRILVLNQIVTNTVLTQAN